MDIRSALQHFVDQARVASPAAQIVTVGAIIVWLLVLRSAWRQGEHHTVALLLATLFCLISENVAIQWGKYHYTTFTLGLPPVPLRPLLARVAGRGPFPPLVECPSESFSLSVPLEIALLEGSLLFAVFRLTNLLAPQPPREIFSWRRLIPWILSLGPWLALRLPNPLLNGFLAVSIDSILDPAVAGTLPCGSSDVSLTGMLWTWHTTADYRGYWFGVPLANYTAWFAALVAFTAAVRVGRHAVTVGGVAVARPGIHAWLASLRAVAFLSFLLFAIKFPLDHIMYEGIGMVPTPTPLSWQFLVSALFPIAGIYGVLRIARHAKQSHRVEWVTLLPIIFVLAYALGALVFGGIYRRSVWLIPLWIVATAIAALHASSPFWRRAGQAAAEITSSGAAAGL